MTEEKEDFGRHVDVELDPSRPSPFIDGYFTQRRRAEQALLDAATDAAAFLRGEISGSSQKEGIIRDLVTAIHKMESSR